MYQAQRMQTTMDMALSALHWKGNPELDPNKSGFLFNEERQAWEFRNISQEDRDVFLPPRCNCKKGCQNGVCSCRKAERACSGVCGCVFFSAFNCCCNKKKKEKPHHSCFKYGCCNVGTLGMCDPGEGSSGPAHLGPGGGMHQGSDGGHIVLARGSGGGRVGGSQQSW